MKYEPNIKDPRVLKRIRKAYAYTLATFNNEDQAPRSMLAITKKFGQAQNPLSQWLMHKLLVCTDAHYSNAAGMSKKYVINLEGAQEIDEILHGSLEQAFTKQEQQQIEESSLKSTVVTAMYAEDYKEEFKTGEFEYKDQSNRLWHPMQNITKDYKRDLFRSKGYRHEYDIECCAPTLLYQLALRHELEPQEMIEHYIQCKDDVREVLSVDLGIDPKTIKMIINALFAGAKLGCNINFQLYNELDKNDAVMNSLKANEYITALRAEIKVMWSVLPVSDKRKSKVKWDLYFELERQVLNAVKAYLKSTGNANFTEHDGWTCMCEIDEYRLCRYVREKTGFSIALDHRRLDVRDPCEMGSEIVQAKPLRPASELRKYYI